MWAPMASSRSEEATVRRTLPTVRGSLSQRELIQPKTAAIAMSVLSICRVDIVKVLDISLTGCLVGREDYGRRETLKLVCGDRQSLGYFMPMRCITCSVLGSTHSSIFRQCYTR